MRLTLEHLDKAFPNCKDKRSDWAAAHPDGIELTEAVVREWLDAERVEYLERMLTDAGLAAMPEAYHEARKAWGEARKAWGEAWKAYREARKAWDEAEKAYREAQKAFDESSKAITPAQWLAALEVSLGEAQAKENSCD